MVVAFALPSFLELRIPRVFPRLFLIIFFFFIVLSCLFSVYFLSFLFETVNTQENKGKSGGLDLVVLLFYCFFLLIFFLCEYSCLYLIHHAVLTFIISFSA